MLTSTNAALWTALRPSSDRLHGVVYAYGQFVITGDNGLMRTTIDATDYDEKILPGSQFVESVTYGRRSFLAVGEAGFAVWSTDAVSWSALTTGTTSHFRGVALFNNQFIAVGTDGTIATTPAPGSPWTLRPTGTSALLTSVAASDSTAVVGFGGTILRSAPAAAPTISPAPRNLIETVGSNVLFEVIASGSPPLTYQWFFNGQPLVSDTSDRLLMTNVQSAQGGSYTVRVSNSLGSVTSPAATLQLVASTAPGPIVDSTFAPTLLLPNGFAAAVEQTDGKIIVGGSQFFVTAGVSPFALARLNRDGSLDNTFAIGSGLNSGGSVAQLILQPDGRVLVAGTFQSINGTSRGNLARLNADGSLEFTFTGAAVATLQPSSRIALQRDGKILVLVSTQLVRLSTDGSVDLTWSTAADVADFGLFADGTIAVLGSDRRTVRRLNAKGSLDDARPVQASDPGGMGIFGWTGLVSSENGRVFGVGSSYAGHGVGSVQVVLFDGGTNPFRVSIGYSTSPSESHVFFPGTGDTMFDSVTRRTSQSSTVGSVLRYKGNGTRDISFDTRAGSNGSITALFALRDGGVLASGTFTTFDGVARPNLVRLVAANAVEAQAPVLVSVTPEAAGVLPGTPLTLTVSAAGSGPLTYKWSATSADRQSVIADDQSTAPSVAFPTRLSGTYTVTVTVSNRAYTVQLTDTAARSGVGLVEVYRADDTPSRLVNLSSRGFVGTASALAIAGIAVEGERPRQFLIRGVGPALQSFGVSDALVDPVLNLTSASGESLARNDDWGTATNATEVAVTSAKLGAFALPGNSKDAALLVALAPGNYTALVSGVSEASGTALIEVYEVP